MVAGFFVHESDRQHAPHLQATHPGEQLEEFRRTWTLFSRKDDRIPERSYRLGAQAKQHVDRQATLCQRQ
jgi:hypothetical protein